MNLITLCMIANLCFGTVERIYNYPLDDFLVISCATQIMAAGMLTCGFTAGYLMITPKCNWWVIYFYRHEICMDQISVAHTCNLC